MAGLKLTQKLESIGTGEVSEIIAEPFTVRARRINLRATGASFRRDVSRYLFHVEALLLDDTSVCVCLVRESLANFRCYASYVPDSVILLKTHIYATAQERNAN